MPECVPGRCAKPRKYAAPVRHNPLLSHTSRPDASSADEDRRAGVHMLFENARVHRILEGSRSETGESVISNHGFGRPSAKIIKIFRDVSSVPLFRPASFQNSLINGRIFKQQCPPVLIGERPPHLNNPCRYSLENAVLNLSVMTDVYRFDASIS